MTELGNLTVTILVPCVLAVVVVKKLKGKGILIVGHIALTVCLSSAVFSLLTYFFGFSSSLFTLDFDRRSEVAVHAAVAFLFWITFFGIMFIQYFMIRRRRSRDNSR